MSSQAISQELSRVRKLKRALEAEIELLRSDMEKGKIHLRVSQNKAFRKELAEKMIKTSDSGYSKEYQGWYVCDPVEGKIYYCSHSSYSADDSYKIVDIEECFDTEYNDFSIDIDWYDRIEEKGDIDQMIAEYGEEDDFDKDEFVLWVKENPDYEALIQEIEEEAEEFAINFAYGEIKDEIIVEI